MKIAAIDLDGTLLRSDSNASEYTKKILKRATDHDILFIPTSGRTFRSIMTKVGDIPGIRYTIGSNGTVITDARDGKIIYNKKIPKETSLDIYRYIRDHGGFYCGYSGNDSYLEEQDVRILLDTKLKRAISEDLLSTDIRVPDMERLIQSGDLHFGKIFISFIDSDDLTACVKWLGRFDNIVYGYSTSYTVEIFGKESNKDIALDYLRRHLGVDRDDVIAIGDSENDLSMIRYARLGAAVENGMAVLKENADLVIPSNDDDGPAHLLEKIMGSDPI